MFKKFAAADFVHRYGRYRHPITVKHSFSTIHYSVWYYSSSQFQMAVKIRYCTGNVHNYKCRI